MNGDTVAFDDAKNEAQKATKEERQRSTISFALLDLKDAEEIAQAIHNNAGTTCTVEQLAGYLNQSARGGGFRTRILSARTFGLIENPRGQVALTDLGKHIVDPARTAACKIEAFLSVPLHKAIYDAFKGNVLPPRAALTREIRNLGVVQSQADRARQVLERSADQAGFFAHGRDRLVEPIIQHTKDEKPKEEKPRTPGGGGAGGTHHPFIEGLLQKLPVPDSEWPDTDRVKWLEAAVRIFDLMYKGGSERITVETETAPRTVKDMG